jgi:hypothetical protein
MQSVRQQRHATTEELLEEVISKQSVPRFYKRDKSRISVVGGDEKGSLKSETVKYGRESQGTRTRI